MDLHEARSIAVTIDVHKSTQRGNKILPTAAAWIPLAHRGDLPSLDETVLRLSERADNLLERMPWLAALAYSIGLPYSKYSTGDLPDSALGWAMKAHSRQHFSQQTECR